MKRPKLHLTLAKLNKNDLPDFEDIFNEPPHRGQREKLRRWRRLKHQMV